MFRSWGICVREMQDNNRTRVMAFVQIGYFAIFFSFLLLFLKVYASSCCLDKVLFSVESKMGEGKIRAN